MYMCVILITCCTNLSGLDVLRTDRTFKFYDIQDNLAKLWDILAVYTWVDTDVGYCQGQCDLV